ncbi:hypothetical protein J2Z32_002133 [Paenibacillus turicensis]|uniref:Phage protein n=1 Tax=Paenibacillus turicensis TaxID=160487 RepID=A0ABS4FT42_9BACL|nr:hypothetical protein [Paenibacillus turicensis]MBP1905503.1 hypothetical protein [Paenibacillus turicensis]
MKKFQAIEDFIAKHNTVGERRAELEHRRKSAIEEVQALKAEYTAAVRKSVLEGEDNVALIEELDGKIQQAERTYRRIDAEVSLGLTLTNDVDGREAVADAWNTDYYPNTIMRDTLEPALEKLKDAGRAYAEEYQRVLTILNDVDALHYKTKKALGWNYEYRLHDIKGRMRHTNSPLYMARLDETDLEDINAGTLPQKLQN